MKNLPDQLINSNCPLIEYRTRKVILDEIAVSFREGEWLNDTGNIKCRYT